MKPNPIGWLGARGVTLNPVLGCRKVSAGCDHCWAVEMANRLASNPKTPQYENLLRNYRFNGALNWDGRVWIADSKRMREMFERLGKKPRAVFVCSMSDLFYEKIPAGVIRMIFYRMQCHNQHQFIILTKRPERLEQVIYGGEGRVSLRRGDFLQNVHIGVSVENQETADKRIAELVEFNDSADGRWSIGISAEPLLGEIIIPHIDKLKWVLAGSETGSRARPARVEWFLSLANHCHYRNIPFYLKQMTNKQHHDRVLAGCEWNKTAWEVKDAEN